MPSAAVVEDDEIIVQPTTKRAKIKGTWHMHYGDYDYDFVDKQSYDIPLDLYNYLVSRDCVYDTI